MALKVRRLAILMAAILGLLLPAIALSAVYIAFAGAAQREVERRGLPEDSHNALKHAYAAAEFYSVARLVLSAPDATGVVTRLGKANEWLERYLHSTDWSAEVYKDLRNNLLGIAAAEWLRSETSETGPAPRLRLIGKLAEDDDLVDLDTDPRLPELPLAPDTATAIAVMDADEAGLLARFTADLTAKREVLRRDLGL